MKGVGGEVVLGDFGWDQSGTYRYKKAPKSIKKAHQSVEKAHCRALVKSSQTPVTAGVGAKSGAKKARNRWGVAALFGIYLLSWYLLLKEQRLDLASGREGGEWARLRRGYTIFRGKCQA